MPLHDWHLARVSDRVFSQTDWPTQWFIKILIQQSTLRELRYLRFDLSALVNSAYAEANFYNDQVYCVHCVGLSKRVCFGEHAGSKTRSSRSTQTSISRRRGWRPARSHGRILLQAGTYLQSFADCIPGVQMGGGWIWNRQILCSISLCGTAYLKTQLALDLSHVLKTVF